MTEPRDVAINLEAGDVQTAEDFASLRRDSHAGFFSRISRYIRDATKYVPPGYSDDDDDEEEINIPSHRTPSSDECGADEGAKMYARRIAPGTYQRMMKFDEDAPRSSVNGELFASAKRYSSDCTESPNSETDSEIEPEFWPKDDIAATDDSIAAIYLRLGMAESIRNITQEKVEIISMRDKIRTSLDLHWSSLACERIVKEAIGILRSVDTIANVVPSGGELGMSRERRVQSRIAQAIEVLLDLTRAENNSQ